MKLLRFIFAAGILLARGGLCFAQAPASQQGFDAYRILVARNIFDPDRQPMATTADTQPRTVEPPHRATDYVTLTGVMVNDGKALAFFSGSRADYDKVIEANGEIAGAKVTRIAPNGIEVDRGGKKIVVAVGQTVPFDGSAPGTPPASARDASAASAPAAAATGKDAVSPGATPLPGNLSDVMRRMMERRQKELQ